MLAIINNFSKISKRLLYNNKMFSTSIILKNKPMQEPTYDKDKFTQSMTAMSNMKPNSLEKRFLVWAKKYKSIEEVPARVPQATMEHARNKMRIRLANIMMLLTVLGCIGFIISGKRAAERGESIQQMNLDWHKQFNEDQQKIEKFKKLS